MALQSRCRFSSARQLSSRCRAPAFLAFSRFCASLRAFCSARFCCRQAQDSHPAQSPQSFAAGASCTGSSWSSKVGIASSLDPLASLESLSSAAASGSSRPGISSSVSPSDATPSKRE